MPIIRRKLDANTVYPTNIRYNPDTETVQSLIGDEWVDNPAADPRTQTSFPPRLTSDPACDAGRSVADAIKGQIQATITAVGNASTAASIAGLILGLFTFGVFEIFIGIALTIANGMIDAGSTALTAALPDSVFDTLACILDCHMDSSGRLNTGELGAVESDVDDQIGGLGATILNAMLSLAGEGGINNLASLGTSTGDCSDCGCEPAWCYEFDFTLSDGGWSALYGTWVASSGWQGTTAGSGVSIIVDKAVSSTEFTHVEMDVVASGTCNISVTISGAQANNEVGVATGTYSWDGSITGTALELNPSSGAAQGANVTMSRILFRGTGTNPFGSDNCT